MDVQQVYAAHAAPGRGSHQTILAGRRYRLCLDLEQQRLAERVAGCCRAVWNAALEQRRLAWELCGESVWSVQQMAELPSLKRSEGFEWLAADGIAQSLQQTLRDLDAAYRRWLSGQGGRPRFKRKGRADSFRLPQGRRLRVRKLNRRWAEVRLPKLGWWRFRLSRALGGKVRHATVSRDPLGWHISFCVELQRQTAQPNGGPPVGADRGIAATVALSTGELHHCPKLPAAQAERLRRLCRKAGRQETLRRRQRNGQRRRSCRQQHTLDQISGLRAREARIRADWLHKLSIELVSGYGLVAIEDLRIKNMTRSARGTLVEPGVNVRQKAGLNRQILAQGWSELSRQLEYKADWYGSELVRVPAPHTSHTCAVCGVREPESRESQVRFRCIACGHTEHADVNAARVILARAAERSRGRRPDGSSQRGEPSRHWPGRRTANPWEQAA